jgi:ATP-dependent Lon protease
MRRNSKPGYALGMAWTGVGGTVLPVEILAIPGGKGQLKLTGSLGKVMQESAETAFSLVRSVASEWNVDSEYFNTTDFHIHVPDGATPKDGPSAGVTMTMALLSLIRKKCLKSYVSMTGEVTLHGRVTAIGGLREKCVAALRAGIREVILPEENRKDFEELPEQVREKLEFHFVKDFREAVKAAFPAE